MLLGFALFLALWALTVDVWKLPRFSNLPGPAAVVQEWLSRHPAFGLSIYTPDYYLHILTSLRRVLIAFALATIIGVPLGLMIGWSQTVREYVFPPFELLRPIPALAWVPLSILMFKSTEGPVIYITFLPAFFATTLNTVLGVESIDNSYFRAAACLGASPWQTFRHVVIPGALPFIHRPADFHGGRLVFARRGRNDFRRIRPRLRDLHLVHDGELPDDRHRHDHAGYRRVYVQRRDTDHRQSPDALARARAWG
ncbi:MAG TPA: ABC transporter permease [Xanthobacteraceae bacterium]